MAMLNDNDADDSCGPGTGCWNGVQGKINKGKPMMAFKRKKKAAAPDSDSDDVKPQKAAGLNMNMRDLGSDPGQVKLKTYNNKTSLNSGQETQGAANDRSAAEKKKTIFGFKKRM